MFKGFRPTLGYGFVFFCFFVFPKVFTKPKQPSRKPKIPKKTKENQKNIRENQKTKLFKVSDPPLDMGLVFVVAWFPQIFLQNQNNLRENQKY